MLYGCITYLATPFNRCFTALWPGPPTASPRRPAQPPRAPLAPSLALLTSTRAQPGFGTLGLGSLIEHEVETTGEPSRVPGCAHQQLAAKEAIGAVLWLAGEIELGGQHAAAARLHLDMNMARAAGIGAGHDAAQSIAPFRVGELVAAQAETGIVISAFIVGLPEIQQGSREGFTGAGEYEASQFDWLPRHTCFKQLGPLRRGCLEERPFGLPQCCFVAVVACGRGGKRSLRDAAIDPDQRTGREDSRSKYGASRRGVDHPPLPL